MAEAEQKATKTGGRTDHGLDLFRLVYSSRATVDSPQAFSKLTLDVVAKAQHNNARCDVTGLLLAHEGWFVQALEGPRRSVSKVFGVIGRDLRHVQLELLRADVGDERLFGRWSMCAQTVTPAARPALESLDLAGGFAPDRLTAAKVMQLLTTIASLPGVGGLKRTG